MNTSAGLSTPSPLQAALQIPSDAAESPASGGDFTAALAAACVAEPENGMPEGMQSAAALAWVAGMAGAAVSGQLQTATSAQDGFLDVPVADGKDGEVVPDAALSILQGMLAQAAASAPRDGASHMDAATVAVGGAGLAIASPEARIAPGDFIASSAAAADLQRTSAAGAPLALMRATNANMSAQMPVAAQGFVAVAGSIMDSTADNEASTDSSAGERLIGALAERTSMRAEGAFTQGEADRSTITAQNLYTSTRETVASTAGQVSSRPEVVHSAVGSPRWANELGAKLAMMSIRGQHEGSLTLTPEHLGPLEVRITMNQDSTNVWFGAQHADTRAALADALPRLREMFAASGLALGQAGVSQDMPGQQAPRSDDPATRVASSPDPTEAAPIAMLRMSRGLLDTWA